MNSKGVITVKLLIIIMSFLMIFTLFIGIIKKHFKSSQVHREMILIAENQLADYSTYMYSNYGIFVFKEQRQIGLFNHNRVQSTEYIIEPVNSISNTVNLKDQILSVMIDRLPADILDQVMIKLDIVKSAAETKKALDLKENAVIILKDLEQSYDITSILGELINQFNDIRIDELNQELSQLNQRWRNSNALLNILRNEMIDIEDELLRLDSKQDSRYTILLNDLETHQLKLAQEIEKVELILDDFRSVIQFVEDISSKNLELLDQLILLFNHIELAKAQIDELIDLARTIDTEAVGQIINEIEILKEELLLYSNINKVITQGLIDYLSINAVNLDDTYKRILMIPFENIELLDNFLFQINSVSSDEIFSQDCLFNESTLNLLKSYNSNFETFSDISGKTIGNKEQNYYDKHLGYEEQKVEFDGKKIENLSTSPSKGFDLSLFLRLGEDLYNNVAINEYLLGTFKCYVESSESHYDYFDKETRQSYLSRGEVEYILFGDAYESINIGLMVSSIYSVRTLLNTIHIYTDKEKMAYSKTIGVAISGWTGFGEPFFTNLLRVGWAMGESGLDIKELLLGKSVPLIKLNGSDWQLDLGFVSSDSSNGSSVKMTYHDYLRLWLLIVNEELKLERTQDLLRLNLRSAGKNENLSAYYTSVHIRSKDDVYQLELSY